MRILHTLGEKSLGGLEFRTLDQAGWLARHGHDAAIAAPARSAINLAARQRGIATIDIDFDAPYSPLTVLRLRRAVRRLHIDVIDSHSRADGKTAAAVAHARDYAESHLRLAGQMHRTLEVYARAMARSTGGVR